MNEQDAWTYFRETGSVNAYINYIAVKNHQQGEKSAQNMQTGEGYANLYGGPDH